MLTVGICSKQSIINMGMGVPLSFLLLSCVVTSHVSSKSFELTCYPQTTIIYSHGVIQINESTFTVTSTEHNAHTFIAEAYDRKGERIRLWTDFWIVRYYEAEIVEYGRYIWALKKEYAVKKATHGTQ